MVPYAAEVGCDPRRLARHLNTDTTSVSRSLAIKYVHPPTRLPHLQVVDYAACSSTAARFTPACHTSPDDFPRLGSGGTDWGEQLKGVASDGQANWVSSDFPAGAGDSLTESSEPSSQQTRLPKHVRAYFPVPWTPLIFSPTVDNPEDRSLQGLCRSWGALLSRGTRLDALHFCSDQRFQFHSPEELYEAELMMSKVAALEICLELVLGTCSFLVLRALGLPPFGCLIAAVPLSVTLVYAGNWKI